MPAYRQEVIDEYTKAGFWSADTIADLVARNPREAMAFFADDADLTWGGYDDLSTRLAAAYVRAGWRPGERVAVLLTNGAATHVAYLAAQKAGLVTVGIGPRAGDQEVRHVLARSGAGTLLTRPVHRGRDAAQLGRDLGARRHVVFDVAEATATLDGRPLPLPPVDEAAAEIAGRGLGADDVFFINSTSGTTGLPKCVMQTMNNRKYFAPLAARAAQLGGAEVVASVLPAPYGFGQWSAHILPATYGYPTVLPEEFDAAGTLRLVERYRVTVLCAVTSQFIMMLNSPVMADVDLSSLRALYTGGEKVPYARAAEFEDRTGCAVLQFYGSNELGPLSVTSVSDDRRHRLGTVGRAIPEMRLRLFAADGTDVTASGGPGQCGASGPGITPGYYDDPAANEVLFRPDGWMLTGDLVSIDRDGYLTVTDRAADFIIRGGHNISVLAVEEAVGGCPRVAQVAVVSVPDDVLGERVCAFVVTDDGGPMGLDELREALAAKGISKQSWPERLAVLPALPLSTGGKADKALLRADAAQRFTTYT